MGLAQDKPAGPTASTTDPRVGLKPGLKDAGTAAKNMELVATLTNQVAISRFQFSPRGDEVAVSQRTGVEIWSTTTWRRTRHLTNFLALLYCPDARTCWLTSGNGTAGLHDTRTLEPLLPLPRGTLPLAVSPDGRRLAVSVDTRRLQVWDLAAVRAQLRELGF